MCLGQLNCTGIDLSFVINNVGEVIPFLLMFVGIFVALAILFADLKMIESIFVKSLKQKNQQKQHPDWHKDNLKAGNSFLDNPDLCVEDDNQEDSQL